MRLNILNTRSSAFFVSSIDEILRISFGSAHCRSAKPAWTAPKAVEQTKPALPAEIVRFLRPADLEVVS